MCVWRMGVVRVVWMMRVVVVRSVRVMRMVGMVRVVAMATCGAGGGVAPAAVAMAIAAVAGAAAIVGIAELLQSTPMPAAVVRTHIAQSQRVQERQLVTRRLYSLLDLVGLFNATANLPARAHTTTVRMPLNGGALKHLHTIGSTVAAKAITANIQEVFFSDIKSSYLEAH